MITLDADLICFAQQYMLNTKRTNTKKYKSIDRFAESHAAQKSPTSNKPDINDLDFNEIIKILKLNLPFNRFMILKLMKHADLVDLLGLLDKDKLVIGLKFFDKKKLLEFINHLDKDELLKILMKVMSKDELIALFPMQELMKFLDSSKIKSTDLVQAMQNLPPNMLAQIIESATGIPAGNKSQKELIQALNSLKKEDLLEGMKFLPPKEMLGIVSKLAKQDNELFKEFSQNALFESTAKMQKGSIIEGMGALDPDVLIKLLGQLPDELLAQVMTLLDPDKLSGELMSKHKDLLASVAV